MDDIHIKKNIFFEGQKFHGLQDLGGGGAEEDGEPATQIMVLMVVAINGHFKLPIAYFQVSCFCSIKLTSVNFRINLKFQFEGI